MILPIIPYGNPLLRKVSEKIDSSYPQLAELIESMFSTMNSSDGVGLAAPQIGLSIRLFIVDASPMEEDYPEAKDFKKIFINPQIIEEKGEEWAFNEGCLSLPGIREDVVRKSVVVLEYQDENFTTHTEEFSGIAARIIQHEYEHLEGKLFVDTISPLRKKIIQGKLSNILKKKVKTSYRMKF